MIEIIHWPAWYYGPNGAAAIFQEESEVPAGWLDDPAKFTRADPPKDVPADPVDPDPVEPGPVAELTAPAPQRSRAAK